LHPARLKMDSALKLAVVPRLRLLGYKGTMPHFRQLVCETVKLITFQFHSSGGSFVVELAICTPKEIEENCKADLTFKNVTAHDMKSRYRLGADKKGSDHWFVYGKRNYEVGHEKLEPDYKYLQVAEEVNMFLDNQADTIWKSLQI
jgi:Domain of unknown function (DUF4304)